MPREPKAPPPVDLAWRAVEAPKDREAMEKVISKGVARALELASNPKEYAEVLKVGVEWFKVLYGADEDDGLGSGLTAKGANGHGGR